MDNGKRDFDSAAASWDENPNRVKLAQEVAAAIKKQIAITPAMDIADFGCGTGLLSLELQPIVHSVTGIDGSQGMLDVLQAKIDRLRLANVRTRLVDLDKGEVLTGSYDLVVSNMTLHHIQNVASFLAQLHGVLAPGGTLCLTDLDLDGGTFHDDNTGVFHFGFDRQELRKAFLQAGFADIRDTTATEIAKPDTSGKMRTFTVFLMTGRRKPSS
jgi:2-polyprenyl-3-methyl-5-hydroxy-6-metoxy-1,4-benzoquinol methylase